MARYYIIAGEASGDLHGSNLMRGIFQEDPSAQVRFWGGALMDSVYRDHQVPGGLRAASRTALQTSSPGIPTW